MSKIFSIQELAIVVTATNYDSKLLTPSFLSLSGIIPSDWKFSRKPVVSDRASQLSYDNGVTLAAQAGRFMVIRSSQSKTSGEVDIAPIVENYAKSLPQLDFQGVGINIRGYVSFPEGEEEAHEHFFQTVFAPRAWQNNGTAPVQAAVNLVYTFDQRRLLLSITEAKLQIPDQVELPILLFSGNFDYELSEFEAGERINRLKSILASIEQDIHSYEEIVHQFLSNENSPVAPELAVV